MFDLILFQLPKLMRATALTLIAVLVQACALRALLREHLGVKCRTQVKRRPAAKRDHLRGLEEGSKYTGKISASGVRGLKVNVILIKIH